MNDKFDDFDVGPQSDEHYTIQDAWLDYERALNSQTEWVHYFIYNDDGTHEDVIYAIEK